MRLKHQPIGNEAFYLLLSDRLMLRRLLTELAGNLMLACSELRLLRVQRGYFSLQDLSLVAKGLHKNIENTVGIHLEHLRVGGGRYLGKSGDLCITHQPADRSGVFR